MHKNSILATLVLLGGAALFLPGCSKDDDAGGDTGGESGATTGGTGTRSGGGTGGRSGGSGGSGNRSGGGSGGSAGESGTTGAAAGAGGGVESGGAAGATIGGADSGGTAGEAGGGTDSGGSAGAGGAEVGTAGIAGAPGVTGGAAGATPGGAAGTAAGGTGGAAGEAGAGGGGTPLVINEAESSGDTVDWIELFNPGTGEVDLSGWVLKDSNDTSGYTLPAGTVIPAGGFLVVDDVALGFGLGSGDSARLFDAGGVLVDSYAWTSHALTSYGRCPSGSGELVTTFTPTKGTANDCGLRINEVESSGDTADWIELLNGGSAPLDLSGWVLKDSNEDPSYTLPAGTVMAAGAYLVVDDLSLGFGLGGADSARLFDASGALVESYSWTAHAVTSYGRCPDASGTFTTTGSSTRGAANDCAGIVEPTADPWPGANLVTSADVNGALGGNLSDLFYEDGSPDVLWAVRNNPAQLYRLTFDGSAWTPETGTGWDTGKLLHYPDGTGSPDAEGVTKADLASSVVYVASERNNDAGTVVRASILSFDTSAAGAELTATREWNLSADLPNAGANLGLEGIAWIPDTFLVAQGFYDQAAAALYEPSRYADHGTGLFFVGLQVDGMIYAYALDHVTGSFVRVAALSTGATTINAVYFDRDVGYLYGFCGSTCGGLLQVLAVDQASASTTFGQFTPLRQYARPTSMQNLANEGIAIAPESSCVSGFKAFYWTDDAAANGETLHADSIPCGAYAQ